ncbi:MAG: hypothetical protein ACI4J0_10595 [Huintestinicola sp.]|uniref:hypothetical protein n=1 Tax=Huintestinicola sp. TaxID=2981661 RepID=UPI003F10A325
MADRRYAKFFAGSVIKLVMFIVLCAAAAYASGRLLPSPFDRLAPAAAGIVISWFFLTVVEGGKRSFFAKGFLVENVVPGGTWGFGVAFAGPLIGLAFKVRYFNWNADIDITGIFLTAVASGLLSAIVIYGYFFHVIRQDFGAIPAVIISSLLYGFLSAYEVSSGLITYDIIIPAAAYYTVIGIAAGILILQLGDMRSAAAFLFIYSLTAELSEAFTTGGRSFGTDIAAPAMAALCCLSMFIEMYEEKKKRKKEQEI